jgi:hypothetical protein
LEELNIFGVREMIGDKGSAIDLLARVDFHMQALMEGYVCSPGDSLGGVQRDWVSFDGRGNWKRVY